MTVLGPHRRPPLALRAFIALIGLGAGAATAMLMLSDRAPDALRRVFGRLAVRISERLDADSRARLVDAASDPRLPAGDRLVHLALWATVTALAGLAVWSWAGLVVVIVVIGAASIVVEVLQGRLTDTRVVDAADGVANLAGVALGAGAAACCYVVWSAVAALFGRRR